MSLKAFEYKISLGQNFIFDAQLLDSLVAGAGIKPGDRVLEIGAGRGDLTLALHRAGAIITSFEIDQRLEPVLQDRFSNLPGIRLIMQDAMQVDLAGEMGEGPFLVVANLPYYLTTPLLVKLLHLQAHIQGIHVMVQQEAANRLFAKPGTPEYGPLAVLVQYKTNPRLVKKVPAAAFTPPPKVDSAFVSLPFVSKPPVAVADEKVFFKVVQVAFAQRRKTLVNNLMHGFSFNRAQAQALVQGAGLPPQVRGERLDLVAFAALSNQITENKQ